MQTLLALRRLASLFSLTPRLQARYAPIWSLVLACSTSGCTILFDSARTQCQTDSDCRAVGLLDGVCIDNVCQPSSSSPAGTPARAATTQPTMASAGLGGTTAATPTEMQAPSAGQAGAPSSLDNERTPPANTAGTPSRDEDAGATEPGIPGMTSTECKIDADCSALGIAGGKCVEGHCWEPEAQCTTDDDCIMRGPEFVGGRCQNKQCEPNPKWRCEPPPPTSATDTREVTLPVIDALGLRYIADVPILACNKLDYTCMNPIAMAVTNSQGEAKLTVPANFAGYMQQTERNDYVPAMYFMPPMIPEDGRFSNFPLVPNGSFTGLALALGTQVDRSRGHAMLIIEDCQGLALPGIKFSTPQADDKTTEFYVIDQIPTTSAKETPPEGDGGFANLPEGPIEITATEVKTGLVVNKVTLLIRASMITTMYIKPAFRGATTTGRFPLGP